MISRIKGKVRSKTLVSVVVEINDGSVCYEVFIPKAVMKSADISTGRDSNIDLVTYHYYQTDPSKSIPILIGFLNEIEREFFEKFITVSGVGPKAACRALVLPFSEIADAIDRADYAMLKRLPGIGEQRAKEIIAKLQGKIGKFGLIQDRHADASGKLGEDLKEEALSVLSQLQYKKKEAAEMIEKALRANPEIRSSEELLNEVYKEKRSGQRR